MAHFCFKPADKLSSEGYPKLFKQGVRYATPCLFFYYAPSSTSDEQQRSHLGLAISKKNVDSSVQRNLIKRLCREGFRLHRNSEKPLNVVVVARPAASQATREAIRECVEQFWQRVLVS